MTNESHDIQWALFTITEALPTAAALQLGLVLAVDSTAALCHNYHRYTSITRTHALTDKHTRARTHTPTLSHTHTHTPTICSYASLSAYSDVL